MGSTPSTSSPEGLEHVFRETVVAALRQALEQARPVVPRDSIAPTPDPTLLGHRLPADVAGERTRAPP